MRAFKKIKKFFSALSILTLFLASGASAAFANPLNANGRLWLTDMTEVKLQPQDKGTWAMRDFRDATGNRIHGEWIEGAAIKDWQAPQEDLAGDDGLIGDGAQYATMKIGEYPAIFETRPTLGHSLTVSIPQKAVLTLESQTADLNALSAVALELLKEK